MHVLFSGLPDVFVRIVPELADFDWPDESLATCSSCAMADRDGARARGVPTFLAGARCCTYRPVIPSFHVGRALREGGLAAEMFEARLPHGVADPLAVQDRGEHFEKTYLARGSEQFGRDLEWRCPYYVGGEHACGVWRHRNAVCRTWFCKHVDGPRGFRVWRALRDVLAHLELLFARWLARLQPVASDAGPDEWAAYYRWCADRLDAVGPDEIHSVLDSEFDQRYAELREAIAALPATLPDVVQPCVRDFWPTAEGLIYFVGYSRFDGMELPNDIFVFLSRLDGATAWRDALAAAEAALGRPLGEDLVRRMWRSGLLERPTDPSTLIPVTSMKLEQE